MYVDFLTLATPAMILAVIIFQIFATLRVKADSGSSPEQKRMQLRLIWLLPLVGAALVFAVLRDEPRPARSSRVTSQSQGTPPIAADAAGRKQTRKGA
jgi:hypothetical protein